jgi:hypothetical protein
MNHHTSDANGIGSLNDPQSSIPSHGSAEASALARPVNGQPSKYNDRKRVWHIPPEAPRGLVCDDGT